MASEDFEMAWRMIPEIKAQMSLESIAAVSYPHMKKDAQEKLHRKLHKTAFPKRKHFSESEEESSQSLEMLAVLMSGRT